MDLNPEEDRISNLPDCIIHHILSLLPSTREAIRTGILSKRWQNQWTRVPVLIFESDTYGMSSNQSDKNFLRLIDNALHLYDCSKIKKFQLGYEMQKDPDFTSKLRFATRKHVEQLILYCYFTGFDSYLLPKFLIDSSALVEMRMFYCCFKLDWSINWPSLKTLEIVGWSSPSRPLIGKLLSGCPMLESFELRNSDESGMNEDDHDVIASKTLKRLHLSEIDIYYHMEISCPNLVELVIRRDPTSGLRDEMIEISCPNLKSVDLCGSNFKLVNCPSLVYASLDFEIHTYKEDEDGENVGKQNLVQLQHVKELTVSSWFIKILSALEMEGLSYPMLNNKILTLHATDFEHLPDTVCALRSSPMLERLIIKLLGQMPAMYEPRWDLNDSGDNYWNSNAPDFNCLVPHLRFVEIFGLSKLVFDFIEFVLKNARVLEKLVVVISKDRGTDYGFKVSQKMLSFPRCSPHAIVELSMW